MWLLYMLSRQSSFKVTKRLITLQCRSLSSRLGQSQLQAVSPLARSLDATGLWRQGQKGKKTGVRVSGDKSRVNIVSEMLCGRYTTASGAERQNRSSLY